MRSLAPFAITAIGLVCCCAFALEAAPSDDIVDDHARRYPMTYRLQDLPVWSKDGDYDPSVLVALIESTVSPGEWNATSTLAPQVQEASLVVSTTSANHRALANLMKKLRATRMGRAIKDCGSCGQTKQSVWR